MKILPPNMLKASSRLDQFHLTKNLQAKYSWEAGNELSRISNKFQNSKISKFVIHCLQAHAKALPSYMKDISDFVNKVSETENITKDTFLVTLYVK